MVTAQVKLQEIIKEDERYLLFFLAPDNCTCATGWAGNICEIRKFFDDVFYFSYFIY